MRSFVKTLLKLNVILTMFLAGATAHAQQPKPVTGTAASASTAPSQTQKNIEAYLRKLVSRNAPFDRYVAGDSNAISANAKKGLKRAHEEWPNTALKGPLSQALATPSDFEQAAAMVDEEDMAESTPHGPDPQPYLDLIRDYEKAGFTHVYMHQIGDNQDEFLDFAGRELLPNI